MAHAPLHRWVNRKDPNDTNIFGGGFLGLDNIGVIDRSQPLPGGGALEQADGTSWMAFFCVTMLDMAIELARHDRAYDDIASKFFEHFVQITDAVNTLDGHGLWHEEDGFYYDAMRVGPDTQPLKVRSMVGLTPLFAVLVIRPETLHQIPGFAKRMAWFLDNRKDLADQVISRDEPGRCTCEHSGTAKCPCVTRLLAVPTLARLQKVLAVLFDEDEFLSPFGIRSLSLYHKDHPFVTVIDGKEYRVSYCPGESDTELFGGNSNWRGPIWFPVNYLLIEALERYHYFYGDDLQVEVPTGSGNLMNLRDAAAEVARRLSRLFTVVRSWAGPRDIRSLAPSRPAAHPTLTPPPCCPARTATGSGHATSARLSTNAPIGRTRFFSTSTLTRKPDAVLGPPTRRAGQR